MLMTNTEITELYVKNGLIRKCMLMQFVKMDQPWKNQYIDDLMQDIILYMLTYPKLSNVHENKHMNAWLTRVIQNNIYSNSSAFWTTYLKYNQYGKKQVDLDDVIYKEEIADGEEED